MIRPLLTALRILTIIPVPGKDTDDFSNCLPYFPVIGFLLGIIGYGLFKGFVSTGFFEPGVIIIIVLLLETVLTGGLHIDGLGDISDGFGSGKKGDAINTIINDPRIGTFGVCAVVFDILMKAVCWYILFTKELYSIIIFSLVFSRNIQVLFILFLPISKKSSLLKYFRDSKSLIKFGSLTTIILSTFLCGYTIGFTQTGIIILMSIFSSVIFGSICLKKLNGITGDCIGALNEITEIVVLITGIAVFR
jgi:adenosylcobinamide-GDP ribazoletransferase